MSMTVTHPGWRWTAFAARLLLAGVFAYAGMVKLGDVQEAGRTVAAYQIVSAESAEPVGTMLATFEVALAVLLLVGLAVRLTAAATAALVITYIVAIVSVWARGLSIDCGCFGGGGELTDGAEWGYVVDIARDIGLLAAAAVLIRAAPTPYALDRWVLGVKEA